MLSKRSALAPILSHMHGGAQDSPGATDDEATGLGRGECLARCSSGSSSGCRPTATCTGWVDEHLSGGITPGLGIATYVGIGIHGLGIALHLVG